MTLRIIATLVLLIALAAFPLYISIPLGLICIAYFRNYYEAVPLFFMHDVLFGLPQERFFNFPYVFSLCALVIVVIVGEVRKQMFKVNKI